MFCITGRETILCAEWKSKTMRPSFNSSRLTWTLWLGLLLWVITSFRAQRIRTCVFGHCKAQCTTWNQQSTLLMNTSHQYKAMISCLYFMQVTDQDRSRLEQSGRRRLSSLVEFWLIPNKSTRSAKWVPPQAKECSPQAQMTRQLSYGGPADKLWSIFAKITERIKKIKKI